MRPRKCLVALLSVVKVVLLLGLVALVTSCFLPVPATDLTQHAVSATVVVPPGSPFRASDGTACVLGSEIPIAHDGSFSSLVPNNSTVAVSVAFPDGSVLLNLVPGGDTSIRNLVCDVRTTAEALVFLHPFVFDPQPDSAPSTLELVRGSEKVRALADRLGQSGGRISIGDDPDLVEAYAAAVLDVVQKKAAETSPPTRERSNAAGNEPRQELGVGGEPTRCGESKNRPPKLVTITSTAMMMGSPTREGSYWVYRPNLFFTAASAWIVSLRRLSADAYASQGDLNHLSQDSLVRYEDPGNPPDADALCVLVGSPLVKALDIVGLFVDVIENPITGRPLFEGKFGQTGARLKVPVAPSGAFLVQASSGGYGVMFPTPWTPDYESIYWYQAYYLNIALIAADILQAFAGVNSFAESSTFKSQAGAALLKVETRVLARGAPKAAEAGLENLNQDLSSFVADLLDAASEAFLSTAGKIALTECARLVFASVSALAAVANLGSALNRDVEELIINSPEERTALVVDELCFWDSDAPEWVEPPRVEIGEPTPHGAWITVSWQAKDPCDCTPDTLVRYAHKLEHCCDGPEEVWPLNLASWSSTDTGFEGGLTPGRYRVRVLARDRSGNLSDEATVLFEVPAYVTQPDVPLGPSSAYVGEEVSFKASGSVSSASSQVYYRFDWGDGVVDAGWYSDLKDGWPGSASRSHIYQRAGRYAVRCQGRDGDTGTESSWSDPRFVVVQVRHTVSTPDRPYGTNGGVVGEIIAVGTGHSTCSLKHPIQYRFDWSDGSVAPWRDSPDATHVYSSSGTYFVRAQARCRVDLVESEWSEVYVLRIAEAEGGGEPPTPPPGPLPPSPTPPGPGPSPGQWARILHVADGVITGWGGSGKHCNITVTVESTCGPPALISWTSSCGARGTLRFVGSVGGGPGSDSPYRGAYVDSDADVGCGNRSPAFVRVRAEFPCGTVEEDLERLY